MCSTLGERNGVDLRERYALPPCAAATSLRPAREKEKKREKATHRQTYTAWWERHFERTDLMNDACKVRLDISKHDNGADVGRPRRTLQYMVDLVEEAEENFSGHSQLARSQRATTSEARTTTEPGKDSTRR